jgi:hypothetical protein
MGQYRGLAARAQVALVQALHAAIRTQVQAKPKLLDVRHQTAPLQVAASASSTFDVGLLKVCLIEPRLGAAIAQPALAKRRELVERESTFEVEWIARLANTKPGQTDVDWESGYCADPPALSLSMVRTQHCSGPSKAIGS